MPANFAPYNFAGHLGKEMTRGDGALRRHASQHRRSLKMITEVLPNSKIFADQMPDAVFLVDANDYIQYVSAACENIFGYRPEEMIGRPIFHFIAPDDHERTREEVSKVISSQQRVGFENRYLHKDGRELHIMWSVRWLKSERLRMGMARDITSQRPSSASMSIMPSSAASNGAARIAPPPHRSEVSCDLLTSRQQEIMSFVSKGLTYGEIADLLGIKWTTVASHAKAIHARLGVKNKAEALFEARALGLIE